MEVRSSGPSQTWAAWWGTRRSKAVVGLIAEALAVATRAAPRDGVAIVIRVAP